MSFQSILTWKFYKKWVLFWKRKLKIVFVGTAFKIGLDNTMLEERFHQKSENTFWKLQLNKLQAIFRSCCWRLIYINQLVVILLQWFN